MKVPQPRKLPSGSWFIQLRLGGVSIPVTASTEKECKRQAALIKAEHVAGRRRQARSELTLREACQRYIARKERAKASPATIRGYTNIMNNRFQAVMDTPVTSIRDWQKVYDADAGDKSPKTMQNAWGFVRTVCRKELGLELPEIVTLTPDRTEHTFLDPEQIKSFVAATAGDKYQIPLLLCLLSCRSSEIQGLTWDAVDLKENRIKIGRTVVLDKNQQYVEKERTKTDESFRYIPIIIPDLKKALEAVPDKTGPVVTARPNTVYRRANAICEELGFPAVGQHGLRHSFASLCYSLEVPLRTTMRMGGWKSEKVVSEIYTHLDKMHIGKQVAKLEKFFAGS
jgi:integrase